MPDSAKRFSTRGSQRSSPWLRCSTADHRLSPERNDSRQGARRDDVTISNATVELKRATGGVISQVNTRNDGDFEFTGLRAGEYAVHVSAGSYEPTVQVARLIENIGVKPPSAAINEVVSFEIARIERS